MKHFTNWRSSHHFWKSFVLLTLLICNVIANAQTALITPATGGNIWEVQATPNRTHLVIRGDLDGDGRGDLHSLSVAGGSPLLLDEVAAGGDIWQMQVSNAYVVYRGRRDAGTEDLYTIAIDGTGTPTKLLQVPSNNGELFDDNWFITPNGSKVFAAGRLDDNGAGVADNDVDLWSFPTAGGAPTILTEYSGDFWQVKVSNTHAVYRGRVDGDGDEDIFSVSLDGTSNVQIAEAASGGDIRDDGWEITPDGASIIYGGNIDGNGNQKLLSKPAGGGSFTVLHEGMRDLWQIKLTNTHVIYRGRIDNNDSEDLYSVPIASGTPVKLVEAASGGDIRDDTWKFSPDGNKLIYSGNIDGTGKNKLFSVDIGGTNPTQLHEEAREVWETKVSNTHVVYRGRVDDDDFEDLYSVPLNRSTEPVQLVEAGTNDADINDNDWRISPDGKVVVFHGDIETNDIRELYAISINGGTRYKLSGTLQASGSVEAEYFVDIQNVKVFYRADATTDGKNELFVSELRKAPTAIALSNSSIAESVAIGFKVGTFTTTDENTMDSFTYSLVAGTGGDDNGSFQIVGDELQNAIVFDVDVKSSYSIRVKTDDNKGGTFEQSFSISITEPNQAPTDIDLSNSSIVETVVLDTKIGTFTSTDGNAKDTHTYSLVPGTGGSDNGSFKIEGGDLKSDVLFDFVAKPSYSIRVKTDDKNGGTFEKAFTIAITVGPNQAPTDIALSNSSIVETAALNTIIGTFTSTDANKRDNHTYTLVSGTGSNDNSSFKIEDGDLKSNALFDFAVKPSYSIRVQSDDKNGGLYEKAFVITINTRPNQAPTDIMLSKLSAVENIAVGTTIGVFTSADANTRDRHSYSLVSGTGSNDNSSFQIVEDQLKNAVTFKFNIKSSYSIRVRSNDGNGGQFEEIFNITITEFVKAAQTITFELTKNEIFANEGPVTLIATASSGLPIFFSVVSGPGQVSVDKLNIIGPGEILIEAAQPGDEKFAAAPKVSRKLTVKIVTGIEEGQLEYSVYPNPTTDNLKIETHKGEASVYITDLTGRVSKQQTFIGQTTVDIQNLPSGVYVMKIAFKNGGTFIERIVKY
jgi:Secretion system C-terminal sorting domain